MGAGKHFYQNSNPSKCPLVGLRALSLDEKASLAPCALRSCSSWGDRRWRSGRTREPAKASEQSSARAFSPTCDSSILITQLLLSRGLSLQPRVFFVPFHVILPHLLAGTFFFLHTVPLNLFHHQHIFLCPADSLKAIF